jgi:hypothetical protein
VLPGSRRAKPCRPVPRASRTAARALGAAGFGARNSPEPTGLPPAAFRLRVWPSLPTYPGQLGAIRVGRRPSADPAGFATCCRAGADCETNRIRQKPPSRNRIRLPSAAGRAPRSAPSDRSHKRNGAGAPVPPTSHCETNRIGAACRRHPEQGGRPDRGISTGRSQRAPHPQEPRLRNELNWRRVQAPSRARPPCRPRDLHWPVTGSPSPAGAATAKRTEFVRSLHPATPYDYPTPPGARPGVRLRTAITSGTSRGLQSRQRATAKRTEFVGSLSLAIRYSSPRADGPRPSVPPSSQASITPFCRADPIRQKPLVDSYIRCRSPSTWPGPPGHAP